MPWHGLTTPHESLVSAPTPKPAPAPTPAPKPKPAPVDDGMARNMMSFPSAVKGSGMGDACCGQVVLEQVVPKQVNAGEPFDYVIKAHNKGDLEVREVVVTDQLPEGLEVISSSPPMEGARGGQTSWNLGRLKPGETKTIKVTGSASGVGRITHCATVDYVPYICVTTVVVKPSLQLVKTAPREVLICDPIPVKLKVTNSGTGVAENVKINDPLPRSLVTAADRSNRIMIDVGDLGAGESREYEVELKALTTGTYTSSATATSGQLKDSAETTTVVREPILVIAKESVPREFLGKEVTYTVTVRNTGDAPATDTMIVDNLPGKVKFVRASRGGAHADGAVAWKVGTVPVGGSKTVSVTVLPDGPGSYRNVVKASANCAKEVSAQSTTQVVGIPAILLEVIDVEDPIRVGDNVTYVITTTNQGSATGTSIQIVATLEDSMSYVSSDGPTRGSVRGNTITFAPLPSLDPKAKATWKVVVKATKVSDARFSISMTSAQISRPVTETEATNLYD
jgi:uncharacterized repeat protein (TIGR01451 family)